LRGRASAYRNLNIFKFRTFEERFQYFEIIFSQIVTVLNAIYEQIDDESPRRCFGNSRKFLGGRIRFRLPVSYFTMNTARMQKHAS